MKSSQRALVSINIEEKNILATILEYVDRNFRRISYAAGCHCVHK